MSRLELRDNCDKLVFDDGRAPFEGPGLMAWLVTRDEVQGAVELNSQDARVLRDWLTDYLGDGKVPTQQRLADVWETAQKAAEPWGPTLNPYRLEEQM